MTHIWGSKAERSARQLHESVLLLSFPHCLQTRFTAASLLCSLTGQSRNTTSALAGLFRFRPAGEPNTKSQSRPTAHVKFSLSSNLESKVFEEVWIL